MLGGWGVGGLRSGEEEVESDGGRGEKGGLVRSRGERLGWWGTVGCGGEVGSGGIVGVGGESWGMVGKVGKVAGGGE